MAFSSLRFALIAISALSLAACTAEGDQPSRDRSTPAVAAGLNKLSITRESEILWNGSRVTEEQLASLLGQSKKMPAEPELQFQPDPAASYDKSARVLQIVKESGVTKFGFVGNEAYVTPGEQPAR